MSNFNDLPRSERNELSIALVREYERLANDIGMSNDDYYTFLYNLVFIMECRDPVKTRSLKTELQPQLINIFNKIKAEQFEELKLDE